MPNVTYINDLDLDDPNQKGAFNKIAAKEFIKVLPPPGHGAFNEPYNQHNDISDFNKPHLSNPYVNEKFTSITTLPEFENQSNMGPPNMGPPNMGQPNMGPPNMGHPTWVHQTWSTKYGTTKHGSTQHGTTKHGTTRHGTYSRNIYESTK